MYYAMIGNVRGNCGHKHRTISGLVGCAKRDSNGCKSQGGYTDRIPYRIGDQGSKTNLQDCHEYDEYAERLLGDRY